MSTPPVESIRRWLPHIFLLALLAGGISLLFIVLTPLRNPLLLSAATAALTYHVLFLPYDRLLRKIISFAPDAARRQIAGICAVMTLVLLVISPLFLLLISSLHSIPEAFSLLLDALMQTEDSTDRICSYVGTQTEELNRIYEKLNIPTDQVVASVRSWIDTAHNLGPTFLKFLFRGSSQIAEYILALVCMVFCYAHGPVLIRTILEHTPLTKKMSDTMVRQHAAVAQQLLLSTLGRAIAKGSLVGFIAWNAGGHPFMIVALIAALMSLLPLVGITIVWLPLAVISWSIGDYLGALCIALGSVSSHYVINLLLHRWKLRIEYGNEAWMSFFLFLGLVGGLLAFGPTGLIIGPMAVSMSLVLGRHGLPLYKPTQRQDEIIEKGEKR